MGIIEKEIWEKGDLIDILPDANIIGGRFVLTLKNFQKPEEVAKVRYTTLGYADPEESFIVHDVTSLRQTSVQKKLGVVSIRGLQLFSRDGHQVGLQPNER